MKKSFTLIETLVAIFVLTVGILGISFLVTSQISSISYAQKKLIAAYLAQEGIEIVKNIRDTSWLNGESWDQNINLESATTTRLDYKSSKIPDPFLLECDPLKFDGNFFNCSSGSNTPFTRKIFISKSGDEMVIRVTVFWQEKRKTYQYSVTSKIYNWR